MNNRGKRGLYGDVVEEIDHGVGQIMQALTELGIAERSLVVFTSEGPGFPIKSKVVRRDCSEPGRERPGKAMREPTIFWWPGRLDSGVVMEMGSTLDLFSTFCEIAGAEVPADRIMDSYDLSPVLLGTGESPRKSMFFYRESKPTPSDRENSRPTSSPSRSTPAGPKPRRTTIRRCSTTWAGTPVSSMTWPTSTRT